MVTPRLPKQGDVIRLGARDCTNQARIDRYLLHEQDYAAQARASQGNRGHAGTPCIFQTRTMRSDARMPTDANGAYVGVLRSPSRSSAKPCEPSVLVDVIVSALG